MNREKLKQNIIDIFLRNLEGSTLEAMAEEIIDVSYYALRQPTEPMVSAGDDVLDTLSPTGIWQAMMDASPLAHKRSTN